MFLIYNQSAVKFILQVILEFRFVGIVQVSQHALSAVLLTTQ